MASFPRQSEIELGDSFQFGRTSMRLPLAPHLAHFTLERHRRIPRIARYVDDSLVPARIVEAERNQGTHTLPSHVGQIHRWAGVVALLHHSMIPVAAARPGF
jgi:hypothetical protein